MGSTWMEVSSEMNEFLIPDKSLTPIASAKNKVARLNFHIAGPTKSQKNKSSEEEIVPSSKIDPNILNEKLSLLLEYESSSSVEDTGFQVWRGAFLLADFLIHRRKDFAEGKRVVELGSGTGFPAIVAAIFASHVTATDLDSPRIMKLLEINGKCHNKNLINSDFDVKPLDFFDLEWTAEVTDIISQADVIIAADVVYRENISTGLVNTLKKLITTGNKSRDILIATEKRFVFSDARLGTPIYSLYNYFMGELQQILNVSPGCQETSIKSEDNGATFYLTLEVLPLDFPQYFAYERNQHLVLLHLKLRLKNSGS